jgi:hypothetical protein
MSAMIFSWIIGAIIAISKGEAPPPLPPLAQQDAADQLEEFPARAAHYPGGWVRDAETIAANLDESKTLHFKATPAGKAVLGDEDVFLYRAVRKVNNKGPPWYPNVNQQSVGCCVGCGWKHSADVVQAVQIAAGQAGTWKPLSVEVIYGLSRVEIGGGRIRGDGSVGAWARDAAMKYGMAPMQPYDSVDLSTFSPSRARDFGRKGVPPEIEAIAKEHPVKSCALVTSWADVKRAIQQGYPVAVCSDVGYTMQRDQTGRCRPSGTWNHCMSIIAVRNGAAGVPEGGFILNSWGDDAHTGPTWPADAPLAGFWADSSAIERMVKEGDSFALSGLQGFPARKLDWNVRVPAARGGELAALMFTAPVPFSNKKVMTTKVMSAAAAESWFLRNSSPYPVFALAP